MFTGIIRHMGEVVSAKARTGMVTLTIKAPGLLTETPKKRGDSIAVDGACLTVTGCTDETFSAEVMPETERLTVIGEYSPGMNVNLENPLRMSDSLDGHFVQGHIDFTGEVMDIKKEGKSKVIRIRVPLDQKKFFALKGSVAVNGVSLTISGVKDDSFSVSLIPETIASTNLGQLRTGGRVNIEIDVISRYLNALNEPEHTPGMIDIKKPHP